MNHHDVLALYKKYKLRFYHWTPSENLASIRTHGLLSSAEAARQGVRVDVYGGDEQSRLTDRTLGRDRHVHLCLARFHRMEYKRARELPKGTRWVAVQPEVLLEPGVAFCSVASNQNGSTLLQLGEDLDEIQWDLITRWARGQRLNDAEFEAFKVATMAEVLVPTRISPLLYTI